MAKVLGFTIEIQGQQKVIDTTNQLKEALKQIKDELGKTVDAKDYEKLAKEAAKLTTELNNVNKQQREYNKELQNSKNAAGSYNALNAELVKLRQSYKALSEAERNGVAGRDALTRIGQLDRQLKGIDAGMGNFQRNVGNYPQTILGGISNLVPAFGRINNVINDIGNAAGKTGKIIAGAFGIAGILVATSQQLYAVNSQIDETQADVRKTAGLTEMQVNDLTESLKELTTKTTLDDLLKIGAALGQLGIEVSSQTISAIDTLNVALGGELANSAEDVATIIGQLRNLFTDIQTVNVADDYLKIGNALNNLGAKGTATADVVADIASRFAGTARALNVTTGEILGLSAAMQQSSISAERAGSGIKLVFSELAKNPEVFSRKLNLPLKEFSQLVEKDLTNGFITVVKRLQELTGGGGRMIQMLDDLGIKGQAEQEVFLKLGQNIDSVRGIIDDTNEALKTNSGILEENAIKQDTLAASWSRVMKTFTDAGTNEGVKNALKDLAWLVDNLLGGIGKVYDFFNILPELKAMFGSGDGLTTAQLNAQSAAKRKRKEEEEAARLKKEQEKAAAVAKETPSERAARLKAERLAAETPEQKREREKREREAIANAKKLQQEKERLQKDANDSIKKSEDEFQKEILALTKQIENARIQIVEDSYKRELAAIEKSMQDKIDAYNKEQEDRLKINDETEAKIIAAFGANSKELTDFRKQTAEEQTSFIQRRQELDLLLFEEQNRLIAELDKKYAEKAKSDREKAFNERLQQTNEYFDNENKLSEAKSNEAIAILQNASNDEQDAVEDNEKAKIAIRRKYDNLIREEQLKQLEAELAAEEARKFAIEKAYESSGVNLQGGAPTQDAVSAIAEIQKKISALRKKGVKDNEKINKDEASADKKAMDEKTKKAIDAMNTIKDFASTVGDFIDELNKRQIARMEEQITAHQDKLSQLQEEMSNTTGAQRVELQRQIDNEKAALAASTQQKAEAEKQAAKEHQKIALIQTIINTAMAVMNAYASPPFGLAKAILAGVAGAAQIGIIAAQAFADGGKVLSGEKIRNKPNIRMRNGDNVLATVRAGEVILNERQQARLGGAATFRRIGVPGFATGGVTGDPLPRPAQSFLDNAIQTTATNNDLMKLVQAIDARFDRLQVHVVGEDVANELTNQARAKKAAVI
jgi:TP901 family phage tail tape measure protein